MHDRLKQFLTMENLSPARFAEELGIQRSGISHLLSGRNKPSFEFLQRMMNAYPDVNYEWLILGKGRPYKSDRPVHEMPADAPIFPDPEEFDIAENDALVSDYQSFDVDIPSSQLAENRVNAPQTASPRQENEKKIARIIVFFTDGTYEEK